VTLLKTLATWVLIMGAVSDLLTRFLGPELEFLMALPGGRVRVTVFCWAIGGIVGALGYVVEKRGGFCFKCWEPR